MNISNGTNVTTNLHSSASTLSHDIPNENITNVKNTSNFKKNDFPPLLVGKYDYRKKDILKNGTLSFRCFFRYKCNGLIHVEVKDYKLCRESPLVDLKIKRTLQGPSITCPSEQPTSLTTSQSDQNTQHESTPVLSQNSSLSHNTKLAFIKEIQYNLFKPPLWHHQNLNSKGFEISLNQIRYQLEILRNSDFTPNTIFLVDPFSLTINVNQNEELKNTTFFLHGKPFFL